MVLSCKTRASVRTRVRSLRLGSRAVLIRSRAPLRISFAGGGPDVPPFPEREGGLVLNATINRYAYGTLSPREDDKIGIESVDFRMATEFSALEAPAFDGKLDLAKAAIAKVGDTP